MKEPSRGSSASAKRSTSSTSNQARVSGTNSHHKLGLGKTCLDFQARKSVSNLNSQHASGNMLLIASNKDSNSQDYNHLQEYAAHVFSGISSLGIDTSPCLQQALVDQHGSLISGEYLYSTVLEGIEFSEGFQYLDLGPIPQQDQWSSTRTKDGYSHEGDLAGIGAQFNV